MASWLNYKRINPSTVLPVTLAEAKVGCRVEEDATFDDATITAMVWAATDLFIQLTGQCLCNETIRLVMDQWPCGPEADQWWDGVREGAFKSILSGANTIEFAYKDLVSVTSVTHYNDADVATVYAASNYFVDTIANRLVLREGVSPPDGTRSANAIIIEFVAGFGTEANNIPNAIRQGIIQMAAFLYEHRGDELLNTTSQGAGVLSTTTTGGWNGLPVGVQMLWSPWRKVSL